MAGALFRIDASGNADLLLDTIQGSADIGVINDESMVLPNRSFTVYIERPAWAFGLVLTSGLVLIGISASQTLETHYYDEYSQYVSCENENLAYTPRKV